jgi:hypothetical protein
VVVAGEAPEWVVSGADAEESAPWSAAVAVRWTPAAAIGADTVGMSRSWPASAAPSDGEPHCSP